MQHLLRSGSALKRGPYGRVRPLCTVLANYLRGLLLHNRLVANALLSIHPLLIVHQ